VGLTTPSHITHLLRNFNQSLRIGTERLWRLWLRNLDLEYGMWEQCSDHNR
jgi:hypothetical protein